MNISSKSRLAINISIWSISLIAWIILFFNPCNIMTVEHCHISMSGPSHSSFKMLLKMNPFSSQLIGWGLMVVAMMLPKLILPIQHINIISLKQNRVINSVLFTFGYLVTWILAGIIINTLIIIGNMYFPMSYFPAVFVLIIALIWQFSPIKQQFLNLGHRHPLISAFGNKSYNDSFKFGVMHGFYCIGSGWAIMLFPMLLPKGHHIAMILVTLIMISEHLEHPRFPKWELVSRLKLFKILIANFKIAVKN